MPAEPRMTDRDLELLSAYIDGELTAGERSELEARLEREPQLKRELKMLRQTVELVRLTPPIRAPRDFTLTPEMVRPPRVLFFPATAAFSALSAVAAALFITFGVLLLVQRDGLPGGSAPALTATSEALAFAPTLSTTDVTPVPSPSDLPEPDARLPEAAQEAADAAVSPQPDASPLPLATVPMPPPSLPQIPPGNGGGAGGSGGGAAGGDGMAPDMDAPQMFGAPPDSFAQGEGMFDMSEPMIAPFAATGDVEIEAEADDTANAARSAAPADEMADMMMAVPAEEQTEGAEAVEEMAGLMMAVPEEAEEAAAAEAQIAQVASPTATETATATATPTEEPTPTATPTPMPTATATPVPLISLPGGSSGVLGVLFVLLGIFSFGLFAISQAARRRRG